MIRLDDILDQEPCEPSGINAVQMKTFLILDKMSLAQSGEDLKSQKQKEVRAWARVNNSQKVWKQELSQNANILASRIIYNVKHYGFPTEMARIKYVEQRIEAK